MHLSYVVEVLESPKLIVMWKTMSTTCRFATTTNQIENTYCTNLKFSFFLPIIEQNLIKIFKKCDVPVTQKEERLYGL